VDSGPTGATPDSGSPPDADDAGQATDAAPSDGSIVVVDAGSPADSGGTNLDSGPVTGTPLNERVLVVYSTSDPNSLQIANYYMSSRGIPSANLCALTVDPSAYFGGGIDWRMTYLPVVVPTIQSCLNQAGRTKILYIVLSTSVGTNLNYPPPAYTGYVAMDSSLSDIWGDMGNISQNTNPYAYYDPVSGFRDPGGAYTTFVSFADYRDNSTSAQNYGGHLIYDVWRIDAATTDLARGLIDRALMAESQGLQGIGCFDMQGDPTGQPDTGYTSGDYDILRASQFARQAGFTVVTDTNSTQFGQAPSPLRCDGAALYAGWYAYGSYNDAFSFVPGSIGWHIDSASEIWSTEAIRHGLTVTQGAVGEPYLSGIAHPDAVMLDIMNGANVGDALFRSTANITWMMVNSGDPLYRPFPNKAPGF
jgi:uncharacterized protein (TIGR03790 family)